MMRYPLVLMAVLGAVTSASAAPLFDELHHDFGSVPRGSSQSHEFHLTNNTGEPLHIAGVRVSCGCTAASALKADLAPGESTAILARMDTSRFAGVRKVTIYVQFDHPRWEEVSLSVQADSREDVTFAPESLDFGRIRRGTGAEASVSISFAGSSSWQIRAAQVESRYVQATFREDRRDATEVTYQVTARVRPDTPVGIWYSNVWLITNNPTLPRVRVPLTVEVQSSLGVNPAQGP